MAGEHRPIFDERDHDEQFAEAVEINLGELYRDLPAAISSAGRKVQTGSWIKGAWIGANTWIRTTDKPHIYVVREENNG